MRLVADAPRGAGSNLGMAAVSGIRALNFVLANIKKKLKFKKSALDFYEMIADKDWTQISNHLIEIKSKSETKYRIFKT